MPYAGRLSRFVEKWKTLSSDPWVLQSVRGYRLPFREHPFQTRPPPCTLSSEERVFVNREVQSLLLKGAIEQTPQGLVKGFISPIFTIPKKGGEERRPIINLRALNTFLSPPHFKMEGLKTVKDLLRQGDFLCKVDLKDAYFMVSIALSHRLFLQFSWEGKIFQFTCLPFGLCTAPWVFTKLMKVPLTTLRLQGMRLVTYIDDILVMDVSQEGAAQAQAQLMALLESLGFLINRAKSSLQPSQRITFLGFTIDSMEMTISLPEEKVKNTTQEALKMLQAQTVSARQLAHMIGVLSSSIPAILPAPLHYRALQDLKIKAVASGGYGSRVHLSPQASNDLLWWKDNLPLVNGQPIRRNQPSLIIASDASLRGWGATSGGVNIGGAWSDQERQLHINQLELLAALFAVRAFMRDRTEEVISLLMDNSTAVAYVNHLGGTRSRPLALLAAQLWEWCLERKSFVIATHVPGRLNVLADRMSRSLVDRSDWRLDPQVFRRINHLWGPLEVDLFATRSSTQLETFFSWRPDPFAKATDALVQNWTSLRGFCNPPWALLGRCLQKVLEERATVVLITPLWPSQPWFPLALDLTIDHPRMLPDSPSLISPPPGSTIPLPPRQGLWSHG